MEKKPEEILDAIVYEDVEAKLVEKIIKTVKTTMNAELAPIKQEFVAIINRLGKIEKKLQCAKVSQ